MIVDFPDIARFREGEGFVWARSFCGGFPRKKLK
jgi:hypothetical protein